MTSLKPISTRRPPNGKAVKDHPAPSQHEEIELLEDFSEDDTVVDRSTEGIEDEPPQESAAQDALDSTNRNFAQPFEGLDEADVKTTVVRLRTGDPKRTRSPDESDSNGSESESKD